MALPAALHNHKHITERESTHVWPDGRTDDGKWEDCAWCSFIMFVRLAYRPDLPTSHAFMESIRARVLGPLGGTRPEHLIAAAKTIGRDGKGTPGIVLKGITAANLWGNLKPGTVGLINGSMGAFPSGHTLRRWSPGFAGGHSVLVARVDVSDRVWWDDPLAPKTKSDGTAYVGQWVSKADVLKFAAKLGSHSFVAPIKGFSQEVNPAPTPTPDPVPVPTPTPTPDPTPAPSYNDGYTAGWNDATTAAGTAFLGLLPPKR